MQPPYLHPVFYDTPPPSDADIISGSSREGEETEDHRLARTQSVGNCSPLKLIMFRAMYSRRRRRRGPPSTQDDATEWRFERVESRNSSRVFLTPHNQQRAPCQHLISHCNKKAAAYRATHQSRRFHQIDVSLLLLFLPPPRRRRTTVGSRVLQS